MNDPFAKINTAFAVYLHRKERSTHLFEHRLHHNKESKLFLSEYPDHIRFSLVTKMPPETYLNKLSTYRYEIACFIRLVANHYHKPVHTCAHMLSFREEISDGIFISLFNHPLADTILTNSFHMSMTYSRGSVRIYEMSAWMPTELIVDMKQKNHDFFTYCTGLNIYYKESTTHGQQQS